MNISTSQRGLSEVLGAILVFALVLSVLIIVQTFAVPTANAQVEFEHSAAVEAELGELGESFDRLAATGGSESVSIQAGMQYPSRMFLMNPPPVSYTFASNTPASEVTLSNLRVAGDREADEWVSGVRNGELTYETRTYSLSTDYTQYQNAPTYHLEGGVLYKRFANDATSFIDTGSVVDGQRVNLVVFEGDIGEGGSGSLTLQASAVSTTTQSVTVEGDGGPITIEVPTELDQSAWEELLDGQPATVTVTGDVATITLDEGQTYDLRITKLRVGTTADTNGPAYLTAPSGTDVSMSGEATTLGVEVRDEFNNPLSGVPVTFAIEDGGAYTTLGTATSDERGLATFRYTPSEDSVVRASIGTGDHEQVDFSVDVLSDSVTLTGTDGSDFINPSATVVLVDAFQTGSNGDERVEMVFENKAESTKTLTEMRVNFFMGAKPGNNVELVSAKMSEDAFATSSPEMDIGGALVDVADVDFSTTGMTSLQMQFYTDSTSKPVYAPANTDEFFVVSFVFTDGTSTTYFVETND